jgi:hypothetical protein
LPETFPGIHFDSNGVCNYCASYEPVKVLGEEALVNLLKSYQGKGDQYDCIAPISGGRDSAFVLHQLVTKYKMRTLALTVDSGFITPEGLRNIEQITRALKVEHVYLRNEKGMNTARKNTRLKFQGWLKKPSINTIIPVLNSGDKTMNLQMTRYAHNHRIPLLFGGNRFGNSTIEQDHWKTGYMGIFPDEHGGYTTGEKMRILFKFIGEYMKDPTNFRLPIVREYLAGGAVYYFEWMFSPRDVRGIGFWNFIYYDERVIVPTIKHELGWTGASDTTTTWRIDDSAYPLINYLYFILVGITEHDEMFSKMVREGQISREEALKRCESDSQPRLPSLASSFAELGVTKEQVDKACRPYRAQLLKKLVGPERAKVLHESLN